MPNARTKLSVTPSCPLLYIIGASVILCRALHLSNCNHLAWPYHRAERRADLFPVAEISRRSRANPTETESN